MPETTNIDFTQEDINAIIDGAMKGATIAQLTNLSNDAVEGLYALAYNLYNAGNYKDAEVLFRALCVYNHTDSRFWMGLAGSCQAQEKYQPAIDAYSLAGLMTSLKDPTPFMFATQCFLKMGNKENAIGTLESISTMGDDNPKFAQIHEQAKGLLKILKSQKK